jgi:hypothetical protein
MITFFLLEMMVEAYFEVTLWPELGGVVALVCPREWVWLYDHILFPCRDG